MNIPEVCRLGGTFRRWQHEVLAHHHIDGASNGPTEAVNLPEKKIKRTGHGFTNFDNYRLRLLLHCGVTWHDASGPCPVKWCSKDLAPSRSRPLGGRGE